MTLDLSSDELLTTTRSVRKRLDLERPVERSVIEECIAIALQAPSGSNRQDWHWVVVTEPERKAGLADLYRAGADAYFAEQQRLAAEQADPKADARRQALRTDRVLSSATYLRDHLHEVPVMVIPCQWNRLPDDAAGWMHAGYWGSILPAAWSFMLALRARGLGSAWTTLHLPHEREAAELLGIPFERCAQAGMFPVAYTKGTDFKPAARMPAAEVTHWEHW